MDAISFETHPRRYRHLTLETEGGVARLMLRVDENGGLRDGYQLKLNSYDLGVDIELADAVNRIRFEHPEVSAVILTSARDGVFCAGANIFMLAGSEHGFKVNFCKFTNETRLAIEDATSFSGQHYIAAVNGVCSGGGYELALACEEIILVDDRRSAVSLPETPYLGVLPGTGGLTRLIDKRMVRRDLADIFATLAEGIRGQKAVEWRLVDRVLPPSRFAQGVNERAAQLVDAERIAARRGIVLEPLVPAEADDRIRYRHLSLALQHERRLAELTVEGPNPAEAGAGEEPDARWYPLRLFRELDDALLRLRFNYPEIGLVLIRSRGELGAVMAVDRQLRELSGNWLVQETRLLLKRVLKRLDLTAKSLFAIIDEESCFGGFLLELVLGADRAYMKTVEGVQLAASPLNRDAFPMGNGLSRLHTRFLHQPERVLQVTTGQPFDAAAAAAAQLVTVAADELDWDDELRLGIDERLSLSPDALTAMEANLRFAGPETLETKIFARLSAWQNWLFQRPNAVGEYGALKSYGRPQSPRFDWRRT